MNLLVLSTFEALGVVVLVLGMLRSSATLVTLGVVYAGAMAWYLVHLLTRVASQLHFNLATAELTCAPRLVTDIFHSLRLPRCARPASRTSSRSCWTAEP
jgi:hypothetical protein